MVKILPSTKLGKYTIYLLISFFVFFFAFQLFVASGQRGGDTLFDNLYLFIPFAVAGLCGVTMFFTGLVALFKEKDRSPFVILAVALGLIIIYFLLGELISPH